MIEPLFPRYLFVYAGTAQRPVAQRSIGYTTGVSRLVRVGLKAVTIANDRIEAPRHGEALRLNARQTPFKSGDRVTIMHARLAYV